MVRYDAATGCSDGPSKGALALVDHWKRTTGLGSLGIFNCRPIRGGKSYSVHAEGRAADLAANANDPRQLEKANRYIEFLITNSEALQVQQIIWNGQYWRSGQGWRPYTGSAGPHRDHAHVELNRTGAAAAHPILTGRLPSPPPEEPEGIIVTPEDKAYFDSFRQGLDIKFAQLKDQLAAQIRAEVMADVRAEFSNQDTRLKAVLQAAGVLPK